ncbi:MAG: hypothetical protein ACLFQH_10270 [Halothiobacillaceae bacterium]
MLGLFEKEVKTRGMAYAKLTGQDKPVFVYKLVAEGTVEERILELQARKQRMADQVYGKTRSRDEPAIDEATIEALLAAV